MEISDVAKSFVHSCNVQPSHDESTTPCVQRQLDVLNGLVGSRDLGFFTGRSRLAHECVTCSVAVLFEVQPNLTVAGKVLTFLRHLAKEPRLLEWLRGEFELHSALVELLQNRLVEDTTQIQLQVIQLLRDVCYRYQVTMTESKIGYLSDFLFKHVESEDNELFLPCLELLNHFSWSPLVQRYMCMMPQLGQLCKSLVPKTVFDNSCVVMHTLAIFANLSLDQFISNKMFSQSMKQTLQVVLCTVVSNNIEAKKISADILEDLINNQDRRVYILKYHKMVVSCAAKIAEKEVQREPDDLQATINALTTIMSVLEFREEYVARTPSTLQPLLGLLNGAVEPHGSSLRMAHASIRLVLLVTQEMCNKNMLVIHNESVSTFLKSTIGVFVALEDKELDSLYFAPEACLAFLQLFQVVANAGICGETIIKQCLTVEHIRSLLKPYLAKDPQACQDSFTLKQVEVVTSTLDFLCQFSLKLENAEECLQELLQESTVANYLSVALCLTKEEVVKAAFKLTVMANFQPNFSKSQFVQSLISVNRKRKAVESPERRERPTVTGPSTATPRCNLSFTGHNRRLSVENSIERISRKLEQSFEIGELKQSEILAVYETKILKLKAREEELLALIETKTAALQQADRLVTKYACIEAKNEAEVEELRSLLRVSERRIEDSQEKMDTMERRNEDTVQTLKASRAKIKALKGHIEDLEQRNNDLDVKAKRLEVVLKSLESAQQEIQSQAEMIAMLQKHGESLKFKFDALTKANEELELANQNQEKVIKEHEAKMKDQAKCLHILQGKLDDKTALVKSLMAEKNSVQEASILLQKDKGALEQQVQTLETKLQKKEEALQSKTKQVTKMAAELDKLKKMQEMIQSISAGML